MPNVQRIGLPLLCHTAIRCGLRNSPARLVAALRVVLAAGHSA